MLTSLATILLVWRSALMLERDPRAAIVLLGLNPIVLVWGLGGDHNDFLMLFFIMLGFYLLLLARARAQGAGAQGCGRADSGGTRVAAQIGGRGENQRAGTGVAGSLRGWLFPLSLLDFGAGWRVRDRDRPQGLGGGAGSGRARALLRARRALVQVVLGMLAIGVLVAAASLLAFGLHIPDLSTQSELVTEREHPQPDRAAVRRGRGERIGCATSCRSRWWRR